MPPSAFGRRQLLISSGLSGALLALASCSGDGGAGRRTTSTPAPSRPTARPTSLRLQRAGDELALPAGFEYVVLSRSDDGTMPPCPDGMACLSSPDGNVLLVRNHERTDTGASPLDPATAYDTSAAGGVTTVALAPDLGSTVGTHVSLSGTVQNCSGGLTERGTWLSCEESHEGPPAGRQRPHGYVFEVEPAALPTAAPQPLTALGRFLHEAVAVDPASGILYLTEDNGYDSGLYRFTPHDRADLAGGGSLEMLAIVDRPGFDTAFDQHVGRPLAVSWVPIAEPDPPTADLDPSAVFNQGLGQGGARFKRLEGCCLTGGTLFVTATEGGDAGLGQVWALDVASSELQLALEPAEPGELFGPDNVSPSPGGQGVMICEDNGNGDANRLHVLGADGELVTFAENIADTTEFAGPCTSPDGTTLFVNIYGDEEAGVPGRTLAITGPWASLT